MPRKGNSLVASLIATVAAVSMVGVASAAPDNKNSTTIGLECDHGVGSIITATIEQNSAIVLNVIDPGPGSYVIHRVFVDGQLVVETPGFEEQDLITCTPVTVNGQPIPSEDPEVVFGGILTGRR
jgi:hypothetical protein